MMERAELIKFLYLLSTKLEISSIFFMHLLKND